MSLTKFIQVRLTPRASSERVTEIKIENNVEFLAIYLKEPAQDSRANKAMLKLLAKRYQIAISKLAILNGIKNRNNLIKVS